MVGDHLNFSGKVALAPLTCTSVLRPGDLHRGKLDGMESRPW
jgi:hypothetical protein